MVPLRFTKVVNGDHIEVNIIHLGISIRFIFSFKKGSINEYGPEFQVHLKELIMARLFGQKRETIIKRSNV